MTPEQVTTALRNLRMLVQYASLKGQLQDQRVNTLAVILESVEQLHKMAPAAVTADLAAHLALAAKTLGVDLSGKR